MLKPSPACGRGCDPRVRARGERVRARPSGQELQQGHEYRRLGEQRRHEPLDDLGPRRLDLRLQPQLRLAHAGFEAQFRLPQARSSRDSVVNKRPSRSDLVARSAASANARANASVWARACASEMPLAFSVSRYFSLSKAMLPIWPEYMQTGAESTPHARRLLVKCAASPN